MRVLLARHGETAWNAEGRYQGQTDIALSPVGEAQARALGERLRDVAITRAVASPMSRARRTAELALGQTAADVPGIGLDGGLAASSGPPMKPGPVNELPMTSVAVNFTNTGMRPVELTLDPGLMEIAHGTWEGLLASEIHARDESRLRAWRDTPHEVLMPEGESLQHVLDRAWPALARACEGLGEDDTVLVVAHDAVNRVLLCRILGLPLARLWTFRQAPTTLNLLEGSDVDHLDVVRLNDCSHHTALFGEAVHRAL